MMTVSSLSNNSLFRALILILERSISTKDRRGRLQILAVLKRGADELVSTYFVTRKKHFNEGQAGSSSNSCGPKARSRRTGEQERKGGNGLGH